MHVFFRDYHTITGLYMHHCNLYVKHIFILIIYIGKIRFVFTSFKYEWT